MAELLLDTVLFLARYKPAVRPPGPELLTQAGKYFPRFEENALDAYFTANPTRGHISEENALVFLPLVPGARVLPLLNLDYELEADRARLQLVMFVENGVKVLGPRAFGYRYEPPEGTSGPHHYWHAQPIVKLRLHDQKMRDIPGMKDDWRPSSMPAFPLDAESTVDLLVCLMISLYGLKEAAEMQAGSFENRLRSHFERIRNRGEKPSPAEVRPTSPMLSLGRLARYLVRKVRHIGGFDGAHLL